LSYAAIIGLLVASSLQPAHDVLDGDEIEESPRQMRLKWLRSLVCASLCAGLVTMPLSAHLFGELSPASLFANIFLVPIATVLQAPAIFLSVIGSLLHNEFVVNVAAFCCELLEALCEGFG